MTNTETAMSREITDRLDTIIALLKLAHREPLRVVHQELLGDDVFAAVLEATANGPVGSGALKAKIAKQTGQSQKTVQRRIADLLAMGALAKEGSGPSIAYRATGLI